MSATYAFVRGDAALEERLSTSAVTVLSMSPLPAGASLRVGMVMAIGWHNNNIRGSVVQYVAGFRVHVDKSTNFTRNSFNLASSHRSVTS